MRNLKFLLTLIAGIVLFTACQEDEYKIGRAHV